MSQSSRPTNDVPTHAPECGIDGTPKRLIEALDELIALARHLRATPSDCYSAVCANDPALSNMPRIDGLIATIRFYTTPTTGWESPVTRPPAHTGCQFIGCTVSSRDIDVCMLNFAPRGAPPMWLCRTHHPPHVAGQIRPVGYYISAVKDQ